MNIKDLVSSLPKNTETIFELRDELEKAGGRIVVEQKDIREERELARTPPAAHTFYAVRGFIDYVKKFGTDDAVVLINPASKTVQAVLEEEAAGEVNKDGGLAACGGRTVISLTPQVHPRWAPWVNLLGHTMSLETFVNFLRMNRRTIVKPDGRDLTLTLAQIRCSTEILLHKGSGKDAVNGIMVKTKIRGQEDSNYCELPESLTIKTPLWVDQEPQEIELDLILNGSADGTNVTAQLSSADIMEAEVMAFEEVAKLLREELGELTIGHGTVRDGVWKEV